MQSSDMAAFACLSCRRHELSVVGCTDSELVPVEGEISCRHCGKRYGIVKGVPRFVADEDYAESFGFQWNKFRRTQLDSYTNMPLSEDRLFQVTQWARDLQGQKVLECGSGAGRFSEPLLRTGATLFSFDLSSAVEANFANNGKAPNLRLFQASIYDIPLRPASFDKVLCLGVLQHTPDPERSFREIAKFVRPGGEIAVDVYVRKWQALLSWKYLLRPITTRMSKQTLFRAVERTVDALLKPAIAARKVGGRIGARLFPILEYSHWGLPLPLNRDWAVLDTFDMYSPAHDHPRSITQVRRWFEEAGMKDVHVAYGPNGVVARGRKPA